MTSDFRARDAGRMGIAGHILGPKKLRRFSALTGLDMVRAYRRGRFGEAIVRTADGHAHYAFDAIDGRSEIIAGPMHWASCESIDLSTT